MSLWLAAATHRYVHKAEQCRWRYHSLTLQLKRTLQTYFITCYANGESETVSTKSLSKVSQKLELDGVWAEVDSSTCPV